MVMLVLESLGSGECVFFVVMVLVILMVYYLWYIFV